MLSIIQCLKKILQKMKIIDDYVVESASEGDWTWQKCDSGIVRLWGVHDYDEEEISCTTKYGNYYHSGTLKLTLPFSLVDYNHAAVSASVSGAGVDFSARAEMRSASEVSFIWCNGNSYKVYGTPRAFIQISGYWKTPNLGGVVRNLLQRWWCYG